MSVSAQTPRLWTFDLQEEVNDKEEVERKVWTVPSQFYFIWNIHNARYLSGPTTLKIEEVNNKRLNNVPSLQRRSPSYSETINSYKILIIEALRSIDVKEEPQAHYWNEHGFMGGGAF